MINWINWLINSELILCIFQKWFWNNIQKENQQKQTWTGMTIGLSYRKSYQVFLDSSTKSFYCPTDSLSKSSNCPTESSTSSKDCLASSFWIVLPNVMLIQFEWSVYLNKQKQIILSTQLNTQPTTEEHKTNRSREIIVKSSEHLFLAVIVKSNPLEILLLFLCNYLADKNP